MPPSDDTKYKVQGNAWAACIGAAGSVVAAGISSGQIKANYQQYDEFVAYVAKEIWKKIYGKT